MSAPERDWENKKKHWTSQGLSETSALREGHSMWPGLWSCSILMRPVIAIGSNHTMAAARQKSDDEQKKRQRLIAKRCCKD